jgi:hypothetical protein
MIERKQLAVVKVIHCQKNTQGEGECQKRVVYGISLG